MRPGPGISLYLIAQRFKRLVPLQELRDDDKLTGMLLTSGKASRLSVQPLGKAHFERIVRLGAR